MIRTSGKLGLILAGILFSVSALAQQQGGRALTPEQQFELLKPKFPNRASGMPQAGFQSPSLGMPTKTEAELAATFADWDDPDQDVVFERLRDGFSIDGARYIDREGTITAYGFDARTGDFTYVSHDGAGKYLLKTGRALNDTDPVTIATAERRGPVWTVSTATGQKFSGSRLIPLARGFVVARDNTGFRYVPGKGTTNVVAPEQFAIAALQSGDISGTGYILLERVSGQDNGANFGAAGQAFGAATAPNSTLNSTSGIGKKEDYALLNIDTRQLVPVNVPLEDKNVQFMSACRQQNFAFAECERMDSFKSLFQPNGMKDMTHYFWRITWLNAGRRPVLISQEGGLGRVALSDLVTGKKVALFERAAGISEFSVAQKADGKISVTAQLGLSTETKDDVVSLIDTLPNIAGKN